MRSTLFLAAGAMLLIATAQLAQAQENVERLKEEVSERFGQSYNKVERRQPAIKRGRNCHELS